MDVVAFRWLAAQQAPDFRSIARFRKRRLSALGNVFLQAWELCRATGMVSLGQVALDGTKVRANASRRKAMSYGRLSEKQKVLADEVSALLADADAIDTAEDTRFGKDTRGNELPPELARRESRLVKLAQARAALEADAAARARKDAEKQAREKGDDSETAAKKGEEAAVNAVVAPTAQRNFTDPDARIMKTEPPCVSDRCRRHRRNEPQGNSVPQCRRLVYLPLYLAVLHGFAITRDSVRTRSFSSCGDEKLATVAVRPFHRLRSSWCRLSFPCGFLSSPMTQEDRWKSGGQAVTPGSLPPHECLRQDP